MTRPHQSTTTTMSGSNISNWAAIRGSSRSKSRFPPHHKTIKSAKRMNEWLIGGGYLPSPGWLAMADKQQLSQATIQPIYLSLIARTVNMYVCMDGWLMWLSSSLLLVLYFYYLLFYFNGYVFFWALFYSFFFSCSTPWIGCAKNLTLSLAIVINQLCMYVCVPVWMWFCYHRPATIEQSTLAIKIFFFF